MEICINAEELRRALADIEVAEKNGFMHCLAVLRLASSGPMLGDCLLRYSDLIERAHPTDGHFDWGRSQGVSRGHRFKNGKLVPIPAARPPTGGEKP